jgi:uncharacterized repeat protein (TIGR01451 family)
MPAAFTELSAGSYTLSEDIKPGWTQTNIACGESAEQELDHDNNYSLTIHSGAAITCEIGNQYIPPEMTIEKSNNRWPNAISPNSEVLYTIILRVTHNPVVNPIVTDLLPKNITYRAGSFKAVSNLNGELTITEPTYASPGKWTLPTLVAGEVVTLTYLGDVSDDIKPGTYKDIAWASGTWTSGNGDAIHSLLASAVDPGKLNTTFVGTQIIVTKSYQLNTWVNIIKEEQGRVLGATTELPATGLNSFWIILAIGLLTVGIGLQLAAKKRKHHV